MPHLVWGPVLLAALFVCGALGAPFQSNELGFETVRREHFDAIAVAREKGQPSNATLVVFVHTIGDARDADLGRAWDWLRQNANVVVVDEEGGAPLYLTNRDLAATSGRATLGATVPAGMVVEMRNPDVAACVAAHEMLHFLGLKHVEDPRNMMYPHCSQELLEKGTLEPWQTRQLAQLSAIRATTPTGVETWATR